MSVHFTRSAIVLAMAALLAGCATDPNGLTSRQAARIDRVLATAPGAAQPSTIVATEVAFARMARDEGQWTAFRHFATEDAVMHGPSGPFPAQAWLANRGDPAAAVQWAPRTVWVSCDATLAVSMGRYRDPAGAVGSFVTVWRRQDDGTYRWVYDGGADDDPQPAPRTDSEPGPDEIVVTAFDTIKGEVADCPKPGEAVAAPRWDPVVSGAEVGGGRSDDGSLVWQWRQGADGTRRISSFIWQDGAWREAAYFDFASPDLGT
ncbi:hypothetical protein [Qipengyuania sp. MTN3-11]|uniref:hypothetical protein n=1 Tax=Qipengyuania sp. MTN3-11 TaxID=3056557 RepID=UPI0036F38301